MNPERRNRRSRSFGVKNLDQWLADTAWDKLYWSDVKERARELDSDGCTGVPDWMIWTCWEHDIHYRSHRFLNGDAIDRRTADYIFRRRIQQGSGLGIFSPISWWRWLGVRIFASKPWNEGEK